ncbi:YebC/PmpR family DNA-binding transcriptional regulator [Gloeobacter morelensis]|uniref:Probable transcriptional regulatory protein ISF26_11400 n=1 Tax=Gloeobacter morelensis MG652769 TaxID=2781736 RepID=A0ABY3PSQ3_9CYAN|nr:YebC/PmpR family DNA-binding transcriptional regulator [Gloeobacter morelensis]UFP96770.1 YebC/PmpR family DNA-binding transcriptional regulator [Gloeobacter morelensis MG652769]
MAGHSKWAQIKRQKAKNDVAKGAMFARLSREIIVATRLGGPDPAGNFRLRLAIEQAKAASLPGENIQRAVDKGSGALEGDNFEEIRYEGYGPAGVAILIEAQTDNRNRTAADLRAVFSRNGGNLGETGCVGWMFQQRGVAVLEGPVREEDLIEAALDGGAVGYEIDPEGQGAEVTCEAADLEALTDTLKGAGFQLAAAEVRWVPDNNIEIADPDIARQVLTLLEKLENLDDVQRVSANHLVADAVLESIYA